MTGPLTGMRVIEGSAFVAAPLGGMTLAQLGADVIRFDQIGGGLDSGRWPLAADGRSLFWAGMNKGKQSIQLDLRRPEGRELVTALVGSPGPDAGMFLTNFPTRGWLAYDSLVKARSDLIMIALQGNHDGSSEVDYTVHPATGFPWATGPRNLAEPLNSVLPTWDLVLGGHAATALLVAERSRARNGRGDFVEIALSDVAFATVGHLGRIAQAQISGTDSPRDGNYLYGAFGHDFETNDGRRVMVVALTGRQWESLTEVTGMRDRFATLALALDVDLSGETGRYTARHLITSVIQPWFAARSLAQIRQAFCGSGVSWGPYQTFSQLVSEDPRCSVENPTFREIEQPGIGMLLTPGSPIRWRNQQRADPQPAPLLGQHTDRVLADVLGLSSSEIGRLHDAGVVAGAAGQDVHRPRQAFESPPA